MDALDNKDKLSILGEEEDVAHNGECGVKPCID